MGARGSVRGWSVVLGILVLAGVGAGVWILFPGDPHARRIEEVCTRHSVPLKAAAVQFPLGHDLVSAVIPGANSPAQVEEI